MNYFFIFLFLFLNTNELIAKINEDNLCYNKELVDQKSCIETYKRLSNGETIYEIYPILKEPYERGMDDLDCNIPFDDDLSHIKHNFCLTIESIIKTKSLNYSFEITLDAIEKQYKDSYDSIFIAYYQYEKEKWDNIEPKKQRVSLLLQKKIMFNT